MADATLRPSNVGTTRFGLGAVKTFVIGASPGTLELTCLRVSSQAAASYPLGAASA
ncbi:hypothetical protein PAXRUDRAFT_13039 [Paxillus rubicundulus Ve08.2h10]|uniref:Uncharacterized protein n=1 Tax=Paxillus rubicundulus Ve08.2h10 TaxID=930991 RepID=A0A0D0DME5_9AGAM|nr:hypothetical protein PAXRUDRAFT_13039 [Paxillus rubicundulus Ve08.2h10]